MNKGFTLIELLVVVLIIGILASIALPQYTKAVERARIAEAVQVLGDLSTAENLYRMQTGRYATSKARLDTGDIVVSLPSSTWLLNEEDFGDPSNAALTLSRQGGMYDGASLTVELFEDGSIEKTCDDNGHEGFCVLAASFGYEVADESGDGTGGERDYLDETPPTGGGGSGGGSGGFHLS